MDQNKLCELIKSQELNTCFNIECEDDISDEILKNVLKLYPKISYVLKKNDLYEKLSVLNNCKFVKYLCQSEVTIQEALSTFHLEELKHKRICKLSYSQKRRVCFARALLMNCDVLFFQEPILNLDDNSLRYILEWIEHLSHSNKRIITTSVSLKHVSLMNGSQIYINQKEIRKIENNEDNSNQNGFLTEKISVRVGDKILLFNPSEIDYIESIEGKTYLNIRTSTFASTYTLEELEMKLKRFGFYRSHRSYLVNMQKVQEIVKWTRNSYSLKLENQDQIKIPLSKGRIEEMKELYHL